jgi:hypothetical protein
MSRLILRFSSVCPEPVLAKIVSHRETEKTDRLAPVLQRLRLAHQPCQLRQAVRFLRSQARLTHVIHLHQAGACVVVIPYSTKAVVLFPRVSVVLRVCPEPSLSWQMANHLLMRNNAKLRENEGSFFYAVRTAGPALMWRVGGADTVVHRAIVKP